MKILLSTYEIYNAGGNCIRSKSLAVQLARLGHDIVLITARKTPGFTPIFHYVEGITIIESPDVLPRIVRHDGLGILDLLWRVFHVLGAKYDLVHGFGHRPTVSIPALIHRFLYRLPYIADWSDLWGQGGIAKERRGILGAIISTFDTWTEPFVFSHATGITVISRLLFSYAQALGFSSKQILLLPAGSPVSSHPPQSKREARHVLGLPARDPLVVYAGFTKHDQLFFTKSMLSLFVMHPTVKLLLIGAYIPSFWAAMYAAKMAHRVIYIGSIPHEFLSTYLAAGDVMLLPYLSKTINRARFPNKLGDYLAAGRPIVTSPTGDLKRVFEHNNIGVLAAQTPHAFTKAVCAMLADKKKQYVLGRNARRLAEKTYNWRILATSLDQFYRKL